MDLDIVFASDLLVEFQVRLLLSRLLQVNGMKASISDPSLRGKLRVELGPPRKEKPFLHEVRFCFLEVRNYFLDLF